MKRTQALHIAIMTMAVLASGIPSWGTVKTPSAVPGPAGAPGQWLETVQLPANASANWWAKAQEEIRRSEYRVTRQEKNQLADLGPAWQAPNRAQNLRTYFTAHGIRVVPRREKTPSWVWGVRLARWGYEKQLNPLGPVEPVVSANRVEYRRGDLVEWYVNDARGVEQGFTISAPPAAKSSFPGSPLVLEMALSGGLNAELQKGNVCFSTPQDGMRVMNFGALKTNDARGRELPSRFALSGDRLMILVEVTDAAFPVTVDPLITVPSQTLDSDYAVFGWSVSTAGDVNNDGWDDVIVGAPYYTYDDKRNGAAFVFLGSAEGVSSTPAWSVQGDKVGSRFGYSVSTAGKVNNDDYDDVIIGAPWYTNAKTEQGAAYLYYGGPYGLSTTPAWKYEGNYPNIRFGYSVSTAGKVNDDDYDDVIIGAYRYTYNYPPGVYHGYEGAAFAFYGSATGLKSSYDWMVESNKADTWFGYSVSTAGDVNHDGYDDVIVGAEIYTNGHTNEGAAFVYHGSSTGLGTTHAWMVEGNCTGCSLGHSVSTAGDVNNDDYDDVIVGAPGGAGTAKVYLGSGTGLSTTPGWGMGGSQAYSNYGVSVSTAGDVNGDDYDDVIVGDTGYEISSGNYGVAFVYFGSEDGPSDTANWTVLSNPDDCLGFSVATAGDVNGDGFSDVISGAKDHNGRAFVYHGVLDFSNPSSVVAAAKRLLFEEDARPGQEDMAAFRYTRNLYEKVGGEAVPQFEDMSLYYGSAEFDRSVEAEDLIRSGLDYSPDDPGLRHLLLDIYYHRTAAAQILAGDLLKSLDEIRLGITGVVPDDCIGYLGGPIIDLEICVLNQALEAHQWALQGAIDEATVMAGGGYFNLFQDVPQAYADFPALMDGRNLLPATYWDPDAQEWLPVGGSSEPLFQGYKDLVLLFGLLRDTGRLASRLAPMYAACGDQAEAETLISSTQRLLLSQGQILLNRFPGIEDIVNPTSGQAEAIKAIAAWRQVLQNLTTVAQLVRADRNPLGLDEDFLIFMPDVDQTGMFNTYDLLEDYVKANGSRPLQVALDALHDAQSAYATYASTQENLLAELDKISSNYEERLVEIVGYSPDDAEYDDAKADPVANAPWGEVGQQLLSIESALLAIERNRQEISNLHQQVKIEVERRGLARGVQNAMRLLYLDFGEQQASLTHEIGHLEMAQTAMDGFSNAFHGLSANPYAAVAQAAIGAVSTVAHAALDDMKVEKEAEKERLAGREKADIVALEGELADIDSDAQIKTWLLQMNVLVIDSQEAALLLTQEMARLKGLINEVERLETGLQEAETGLSRRYFADPIHRMRAEGDVRQAQLTFDRAQRWLFYTGRALEYKWNVDFCTITGGDSCGPGETGDWTVDSVFGLRNAEELDWMYQEMAWFDEDRVFSWTQPNLNVISIRKDVLGFGDGALEIEAFRDYLKGLPVDPYGEPVLTFSTVMNWPAESEAYGLFSPSKTLDKIDKLVLAMSGTFSTGFTEGALKYTGTGMIRTVNRPDPPDPLDPEQRVDRQPDEFRSYSTRFWRSDIATGDLIVDDGLKMPIQILLNQQPPDWCSSSVDWIIGFRERSVATSAWELTIPDWTIDTLDDIKIYMCHRWVLRGD